MLSVWFVILLAVAFVYFFARDRSDPRDGTINAYPAANGRPLTSLQLQLLTGDPQPLSLDDLRGKVTLINLWGPWCTHCRVEMPHLDALRKQFEPRGDFSFVSISCGPSVESENPVTLREETLVYLRDHGFSFAVHGDLQGSTRRAIVESAQLQNQSVGYPLNVLLDRHGVIRGLWIGYVPGVEMEIAAAVERELQIDSETPTTRR